MDISICRVLPFHSATSQVYTCLWHVHHTVWPHKPIQGCGMSYCMTSQAYTRLWHVILHDITSLYKVVACHTAWHHKPIYGCGTHTVWPHKPIQACGMSYCLTSQAYTRLWHVILHDITDLVNAILYQQNLVMFFWELISICMIFIISTRFY